MSPDEQKAVLAELTKRGETGLARMLAAAGSSSDAWQYVLAAYPELAMSLASIAGDMAATWYEELVPSSPYVAAPAAAPALAGLQANARWGMVQTDVTSALTGSLTRTVLGGARNTTIQNADRERVKWARYASASACGFCRMVATRGAVYVHETRQFHDHCHCMSVAVRTGTYAPPPYVADWQRQYRDITKSIRASGAIPDARNVSAAWDALIAAA